MALTVALSLTFSATKVVLTDITGSYNAGTNPGGYGAPNATFAAYGHYAIIRKKNVNSVADVVLTLDTYNPITDTVFQADRDTDGWYEGTKLNIPVWDSGTSYVAGTLTTGNVVVDDGIIYYCILNNSNSKPSLNPTRWTAVSDLTTIEANTTIIVTVEGRVTVYNADVYWSKQIASLSQKGECGICEDNKLKDRLDTIYRNIQNGLVADQLGSNSDGEWAALRLIGLGAI